MGAATAVGWESTAGGGGAPFTAPLRGIEDEDDGNRRPLRIARVAVPSCGGACDPSDPSDPRAASDDVSAAALVSLAAVSAASSAADRCSIPGIATPNGLPGTPTDCGGIGSEVSPRGITGRAPGIMAAGLNLRLPASAATFPSPAARFFPSCESGWKGSTGPRAGSPSPSSLLPLLLSSLLLLLLLLLSAGGLGGGGRGIAGAGAG